VIDLLRIILANKLGLVGQYAEQSSGTNGGM
jgi:hypothetical protein